MATSSDFMASVYDTLTRLLNASGMSASFVMQMAWPGYSLSPADFKAPSAPNGPYDVDVAREAFSQLSNIAPTLNPAYFENSGFEVDDLYEILLSSAIPLSPPGSDPATSPLHRLFSDAQFELVQARRGYKHDPNRFYYPCSATPNNWYDEAATQTWSSLDLKSTDVKPAAPSSPFVKAGGLQLVEKGVMRLRPDVVNEQVVKNDIVRAIDSRETVLKGRFAALSGGRTTKPLDAQLRLATRAETNMAAVAATPAAVRTATLADNLGAARLAMASKTQIAPVNAFVRPDLKVDLQSTRVNPQTLTIESPARLALDRKLLLTDLVDRSLPTKPTSPATTGFSVSFRFCRVNVDRPWFKLALLSQPSWYMFNTNARAYSTGTMKDNPGMFPLLPLSFVAIRDLKITANWSAEDRASLSKAVSFGFFDLRNGAFTQNTYEVKGLQIVAWISSLTPPLPPGQTTP